MPDHYGVVVTEMRLRLPARPRSTLVHAGDGVAYFFLPRVLCACRLRMKSKISFIQIVEPVEDKPAAGDMPGGMGGMSGMDMDCPPEPR